MKAGILYLFLFLSLVSFGQDEQLHKPSTFNLRDSTASVGSVCVLRDVWFNLTDYQKDIDTNCYPVMDSIMRFLKRNPAIRLEVQSYLSPTNGQMCWVPQHAHSVVNYLIAHGIDSAKLVPREFGTSRPIIPISKINQMKTEKEKRAAYMLDRRIELIVREPSTK